MANIQKIYVDADNHIKLSIFINNSDEVSIQIENKHRELEVVGLDVDSLYEFICDLNALHTKLCNE